MTLNLQLPQKTQLRPTLTVVGVGGAGGNAVNNMITTGMEGVNFVVANTDSQAIDEAKAEQRIQLGETITRGLGAGSYPEVGKAAAEESSDELLDHLQGSNMVFIAAGMGGGTGTGAAPVIARLAREQGILTVGVVTKPFHFEGTHRMRVAELGLQELQQHVDTLIIIPNQNLFRVADKNTTFLDAFKLADNVLNSGVRGVTDLITKPGLINLDFADIRSVMGEMGRAMMGTGVGEGEDRAMKAAEAAISNPLLDNTSMAGARGVLINITGGADMTLFEVDEAANRIRDEVDGDANIIFGSTFDETIEGEVRVSVFATGIDAEVSRESSAMSPARKATSYSPATPEAASAVAREMKEEEEVVIEEKAEVGGFFSASAKKEEPAVEEAVSEQSEINAESEELIAESYDAVDEESGEADDDAFISPEPVEPSLFNTMKHRGEPVEEEPKEEASGSWLSGLFSKQKATSTESENRPGLSEPKPETASEEDNSEERKQPVLVGAGVGEGEDLEVPAFMRRKPTAQ